ncbi:MAG: hypothetical protein FD153_593 [Rhodospirillaceae bacterium]|nr:MAG: hypothetical protein FD153_593 [Rhodospirillaceae bacterium]
MPSPVRPVLISATGIALSGCASSPVFERPGDMPVPAVWRNAVVFPPGKPPMEPWQRAFDDADVDQCDGTRAPLGRLRSGKQEVIKGAGQWRAVP